MMETKTNGGDPGEEREERGEEGGALLASVMQAFDQLSFSGHQHNSGGRYSGCLILAHGELRYVSPLFSVE